MNESASTPHAALRQDLTRQWREPVMTLTFKVRDFKLSYPERTSFGVMSTGRKIRRISRILLMFPLKLITVIIGVLLESTDFGSERESRPGTVHLDGTVANAPATHLVDVLGRVKGAVVIAFSQSHVAFFSETEGARHGQPLWQSTRDARVWFGPVWPNKLSVSWPDGTQAWLRLDDEQATTAVQFYQAQLAGPA